MTSKMRKNPILEGLKLPKSGMSSHTNSNRNGDRKKLVKTGSNLDGNGTNSKVGILSSNTKTSADKEKGRDDQGARIAAAMEAQLRETDGDGDKFSDEYVYRNPAPLKWRIFEAVAKTNGQRAFATYWSTLQNFLRGMIPRSELDGKLLESLGAENVHLHNELILCLINNSRCRYIPVELLDQVPTSFREDVVVCERRPQPSRKPPQASNSLPSSKIPLSLQGKRTEGLLSPKGDMGCGHAAPKGLGTPGAAVPRQEKHPVGTTAGATGREGGRPKCAGMSDSLPPSSVDIKNDMASGKPPEVAKPIGGLGWKGGIAADEDNIGTLEDFSEERLLFEIESHFGAGSDVWRPWSDEVDNDHQILGMKRTYSPEPCAWGSGERSPNKSLKSHGGAVACARAGASDDNFSSVSTLDPTVQYRSQRVPGARSLGPYLQALTASQQMKVSHEVCRVMTTGVKEYLRRILEACTVTARGGAQGREKLLSGIEKANGTTAREYSNAGDTRMNGQRSVLTPAHLRAALEASPRLAGPQSSSQVQWRRVAMFPVDKPSPIPARGVSYSYCSRRDRLG